MALLGQDNLGLNPYQGIGPGQQPGAQVQPPGYAQQQPAGQLQGMQQMQQAMQNNTMPLQTPANNQSMNSYMQKQQQSQDYDIRVHMAQFLRSPEGQKVVNDFSQSPDFGHLLSPLQLQDQGQSRDDSTINTGSGWQNGNVLTIPGQNGQSGHPASDQEMKDLGF